MKRLVFFLVSLVFLAAPLAAVNRSGFELSVLVDQDEQREYSARGTVYVEALRGRSYELRLTNPLPYRVAVALSVDGLNTLNAKHTSALSAPKWIIDPYDTIVISGWQISDATARQFFFTSEESSYGARLGQTENLGVIEAVFYRERVAEPQPVYRGDDEESRGAAGAPPAAQAPSMSREKAAKPADRDDDYAATGMGRRERHEIERVDFDLDPTPAATIRIRYEFRSGLVKLGVLGGRSPLERREAARGFSGYCPDIE